MMLTASLVAFSIAAPEPKSHTFDAGGVKLHYLEAGQGEAVILVHGLNASANLNWKAPGIIDELAKKYHVIALDLPGHGQSEKPDKASAYGEQLAEDVVLLMDHLKLKSAHLVGYSLGGMVTMKLLTKHPERVQSAAICAMGWLRDGTALAGVWEKAKSKDTFGVPTALVKSIGKLSVTKEELEAIKTPVTVLVGSQDPVKTLYVEPLQRARKDWPVIEIADAGHLTCVTKKEFKQALQDWLSQQTR